MRNARFAWLVLLLAAGCGSGGNGFVGTCAAGVKCGVKCTLTSSDPMNCGKCGNACASGSCTNGVCDMPMGGCMGGQVMCNNACVDKASFNTDPANCGTCGTACANAQTCVGGACMDAGGCMGGQVMCNNACTDPASFQTDAANCGMCNNACANGQVCTGGQCKAVMMGGGTGKPGDPCAKSADCGGTKPVCGTKSMSGLVFPGGYCVSQCNPNNNAMDGTNNDCGNGGSQYACLDVGNNMGQCVVQCTGKQDMPNNLPCRQGYSCFGAGTFGFCYPAGLSECNPTAKGTCKGPMAGQGCVRGGSDDVGFCYPGCDPFQVGQCKPDMNQMATVCIPSPETGEGACLPPNNGGAGAGAACMSFYDCGAGLECYAKPMAMAGVCEPVCGGPKNVACKNGKMCNDLDMSVKASVVGVCSN